MCQFGHIHYSSCRHSEVICYNLCEKGFLFPEAESIEALARQFLETPNSSLPPISFQRRNSAPDSLRAFSLAADSSTSKSFSSSMDSPLLPSSIPSASSQASPTLRSKSSRGYHLAKVVADPQQNMRTEDVSEGDYESAGNASVYYTAPTSPSKPTHELYEPNHVCFAEQLAGIDVQKKTMVSWLPPSKTALHQLLAPHKRSSISPEELRQVVASVTGRRQHPPDSEDKQMVQDGNTFTHLSQPSSLRPSSDIGRRAERDAANLAQQQIGSLVELKARIKSTRPSVSPTLKARPSQPNLRKPLPEHWGTPPSRRDPAFNSGNSPSKSSSQTIRGVKSQPALRPHAAATPTLRTKPSRETMTHKTPTVSRAPKLMTAQRAADRELKKTIPCSEIIPPYDDSEPEVSPTSKPLRSRKSTILKAAMDESPTITVRAGAHRQPWVGTGKPWEVDQGVVQLHEQPSSFKSAVHPREGGNHGRTRMPTETLNGQTHDDAGKSESIGQRSQRRSDGDLIVQNSSCPGPPAELVACNSDPNDLTLSGESIAEKAGVQSISSITHPRTEADGVAKGKTLAPHRRIQMEAQSQILSKQDEHPPVASPVSLEENVRTSTMQPAGQALPYDPREILSVTAPELLTSYPLYNGNRGADISDWKWPVPFFNPSSIPHPVTKVRATSGSTLNPRAIQFVPKTMLERGSITESKTTESSHLKSSRTGSSTSTGKVEGALAENPFCSPNMAPTRAIRSPRNPPFEIEITTPSIWPSYPGELGSRTWSVRAYCPDIPEGPKRMALYKLNRGQAYNKLHRMALNERGPLSNTVYEDPPTVRSNGNEPASDSDTDEPRYNASPGWIQRPYRKTRPPYRGRPGWPRNPPAENPMRHANRYAPLSWNSSSTYQGSSPENSRYIDDGASHTMRLTREVWLREIWCMANQTWCDTVPDPSKVGRRARSLPPPSSDIKHRERTVQTNQREMDWTSYWKEACESGKRPGHRDQSDEQGLGIGWEKYLYSYLPCADSTLVGALVSKPACPRCERDWHPMMQSLEAAGV